MSAIVLFPPPPVIIAPAGSEVAVEAVFVPVYIHVELMVALTPWACHAFESVVVNAGVVLISTLILAGAVTVESEVADAEGVCVPERTVSGVIEPVCEGMVDAEAAADAGWEEEDTAAAASELADAASRMYRSARAQRPKTNRERWPLTILSGI